MTFERSSEYDEDSYLRLNLDVAAAVKRRQFPTGREHWERYGCKEGRLCATPTGADDFDETAYLLRYPDVLNAVRNGHIHSGYQHWIQSGHDEGRMAPIEQWPLGAGFHEQRYLRANADVEAAVRAGTFRSGRAHWERSGAAEMRPGTDFISNESQPSPDSGLPFGANYFAFHSAIRGLGDAARTYAAAFRDYGLPLQEIDVPLWTTSTTTPQSSPAPVYRINLVHQNADMMRLWASRYGPSVLQNRYNVGLWVWELHAGYASMHDAARLLHEIWVPSIYVANAVETVTAKPVYVVPYVVHPARPAGRIKRGTVGIREDAFLFLYAFDLSSGFGRKNPLAAIQGFIKAFESDPKAAMLLKYSQADSNPRAVDIIEGVTARHPNIHTLSTTVTHEEMSDLYTMADCYVSPHRSEGFGLSIANAMYFGKPAIATDYSGNLDFMHEDDSYLIRSRLVEVGPGNEPYLANYVWAEPDVEHMAYLMRVVSSHREDAAGRGALASKRIRDKFNPGSIAAMAVQHLQQSLAAS